LAVPIGPGDIVERFAGYADEVVCLQAPAYFYAVGQGYRVFAQTPDDDVVALLDRAREGFRGAAEGTSAADRRCVTRRSKWWPGRWRWPAI
jgi:predicted phosphoribosyltransferase